MSKLREKWPLSIFEDITGSQSWARIRHGSSWRILRDLKVGLELDMVHP